jgi:hypothetical protein
MYLSDRQVDDQDGIDVVRSAKANAASREPGFTSDASDDDECILVLGEVLPEPLKPLHN